MKQLFIMALIVIATVPGAFAGPKTISTKVNEHFAAAFKNAKNVAWKTTDKFDKASFVLGGEKIQAFYDAEGELLGTSKTMAFDKLPKSALQIITTRYTYPGYQLQDCIEFVKTTNEKNYYVSLSNKNVTVILEITEEGVLRVFARTRK